MPAIADSNQSGASPIPGGARPIVVASHRRSGTHLMLDFLRRQFPACRPPFRPGVNPHRYLYFVLDRLEPRHRAHVGPQSCVRMMRSTAMPALKTHGTPGFEKVAADAKPLCEAVMREGEVLYCVRDVRAALASLHAFERVTRATWTKSLSEYLREPVNGESRAEYWSNHVRVWTEGYPERHVIRFEDVVGNPGSVLEQIGLWLGQTPKGVEPLLPPKLKYRQQLWLARITGVPESTNVMGRKIGIRPYDWRTAYSDSDLAFLEEHTGDVMRSLGYISGDDWTMPAW